MADLGVEGVTVLGVLGEANRMGERERGRSCEPRSMRPAGGWR
ncbi:MAG: hypothetical protein R3E41_06035 [Burkholderiaceae bacterium]